MGECGSCDAPSGRLLCDGAGVVRIRSSPWAMGGVLFKRRGVSILRLVGLQDGILWALFRVWTYVGVGPWGSEQVLPVRVRLPSLT